MKDYEYMYKFTYKTKTRFLRAWYRKERVEANNNNLISRKKNKKENKYK